MMKTNKKKILGVMLASLISFGAATTAFAAVTADSAQEIAKKWIPAGAVHVLTEDDVTAYEVTFFDNAAKIKYEIEIDKLTEKVTEVKTKLTNSHGSNTISLSRNDITEITLKEFPDAIIRKLRLASDDGYQVYEVKFTTDTMRGELEINPETGVILERKLKY
ncbi:Propeptide PepSY amd peptidase M4 [uncultured Sporomusa sp.]|uniref:Propeptide PepSY amd peptidase M4 n=1 Tax=uncultured Sporomusa sp. TaxID=307249 RepID=A0A212LN07_9FIRM|nr:PepSY domain-containing protein [uncultured Sporomusa sp.]SCM78914.1 Propeptide PepSY amd peptidase M4 [uncultured Sporomusa sp.]